MIFVDTCILIDYSKGRVKFSIKDKMQCCFDSIVQLEFIAGARNKRELVYIRQLMGNFNHIDSDQDVLNIALQLMERYVLSHGMTVNDSIIAATCMQYNLPLWTYNKRDFHFLDIELLDGIP